MARHIAGRVESNAEWRSLRERSVPRGLANAFPIFVARARGAEMWDLEGRRFIDFIGGIGTLNIGSANEAVVAAIREQAGRFLHTAIQTVMYPEYVEVARRLGEIAPGPWPKKALLLNSGSEAVENAVKIARAATGRPNLVALTHAFHGRTYMALALTGKAHPYKAGFEPFPTGVYRTPSPYVYRRPEAGEAECVAACLAELRDVVEVQAGAETVAAVIVEPVQGEGGFIPLPPAYLRGVRELCDRHGILFIDDEVQAGFGRTGTWFAVEHAGVAPDLITCGKSLAAGMPLAAVVGRADAMDAAPVGSLGGTYGGNPLACAAALAVMDQFEDGTLFQRSRAIGRRILAEAARWRGRFPRIGDARGLGGMTAIEIVRDPASREPDAEATAAVIDAAFRRGLLLLKAGVHGNVIRFLPPLVMDDALLEEALAILGEALEEALT